jgi:hypothetical protein
LLPLPPREKAAVAVAAAAVVVLSATFVKGATAENADVGRPGKTLGTVLRRRLAPAITLLGWATEARAANSGAKKDGAVGAAAVSR